MAQVVVYGLECTIDAHRGALSEAIHGAIMTALDYPAEKRFQRFVALRPTDFVYPEDRGPHYTIVEISMFEGRTASAKRALISELFARIESATGISPHSVEITITETPRLNWGIRGQNAQDLNLGYQVDV